MTPQEADKAQQWAGMDGAEAFELIGRHADNWDDARELMNAWLRANRGAQGDPVAWQDIVSALKAVDAEAWERGRMFPQHSDEQDADRAAIRRACELVEWYSTKGGSVAMHLPLWPKHPAPAQTITESWVPVPMVAIDGCRDDILNGRGALEEVLDNDQTNAVLAVFDQYFDGAAPKEPPHA